MKALFIDFVYPLAQTAALFFVEISYLFARAFQHDFLELLFRIADFFPILGTEGTGVFLSGAPLRLFRGLRRQRPLPRVFENGFSPFIHDDKTADAPYLIVLYLHDVIARKRIRQLIPAAVLLRGNVQKNKRSGVEFPSDPPFDARAFEGIGGFALFLVARVLAAFDAAGEPFVAAGTITLAGEVAGLLR